MVRFINISVEAKDLGVASDQLNIILARLALWVTKLNIIPDRIEFAAPLVNVTKEGLKSILSDKAVMSVNPDTVI